MSLFKSTSSFKTSISTAKLLLTASQFYILHTQRVSLMAINVVALILSLFCISFNLKLVDGREKCTYNASIELKNYFASLKSELHFKI